MKNRMLVDFEVIENLTKLDKKILIERALKLSEEVGEVSEAILSYSNACGCGYKNKDKKDVIEECLDVIIVATSLISQVSDNDVDEKLVEELYSKKINKWKQKSEE